MGGWSGSRLALTARSTCAGVIAALAFTLLANPAGAAEKVKMSTFQSNLCCFPVYVAQHLKLFEKHGVEVELVYGTGIQVANILISGSTDFGAFAIEHGVAVTSKGQDVKLLVVTLTRPPFSVIVRNEVPTPNAGKPYPQMLADLKGLKIGISTPGASTDVTLRFLLREAGLDPQKDVTIVPVGDPTTALAGLKNGLIDGNMSVEPTQTAAVTGLKIAKHVLNAQGTPAGGARRRQRHHRSRAAHPGPEPAGRHREGGAGLHARHRCRAVAHLSADLPRELQSRGHPGRDPQHQPDAAGRQADRTAGLVVAGGGAGPHAARASQAVGSLIVAASETDALLIEAGAGVGVGAEPDRRRVIFARLAVLVVFLGLWQLVVAVGLVDAFWISTPALIAQEVWHLLESGALASDVAVTIYEALVAFVISSALGIICGLLLARSPFWDDVLAPFVLALNSLPRVALAPLIILWFGIGVMAKVVTAFTLVFFILLVNTLGGAKNVDNDIITIARLMGASERDILWKVTFPSALPWIFTGLNLGLTYSLLGVIVAEILASNHGLGYLIAASAASFNTAGVFAGLITLAVVAWLFSLVMRKVEARLLRWKPSLTSA
jgi:NitT/TauT family transport system permease protein